MKKVGFTTTIPVEIIFAANLIPVDLNNIFITDNNPHTFIDFAEQEGLPRNTCNWIKGIYTSVMQNSVDKVISVTGGDCSNNHALTEIFRAEGIDVITFNYPYENKSRYVSLKSEMSLLAAELGTDLDTVQKFQENLQGVRSKLKRLDELTVENKVSGFENHLWLVSSTDFNGDYLSFEDNLIAFLDEAQRREEIKNNLRIGFVGVPPIFTDLYEFLENKGVHIAFNEVQRQFSIISEKRDIVEKYLDYTYPYDISCRIEDINREIKKRKLDGIIHYVQSFCYRQLQDLIIKREIEVPVITIEGNEPGGVDARTKIRLESFIEMLEERKK